MSRSATVDVDLVVFDLDGTLYADVAVYRQYTREFARLLGEERRPAFLADVRGALTGTLPAGLGAVYDRQTGLVARPAAAAAAPGGAVHWYTWEGTLVGEGGGYPAWEGVRGRYVPMGDVWSLLWACGVRHGLGAAELERAHCAARLRFTAGDLAIRPLPGLRPLLEALAASSPAPASASASGRARRGDAVRPRLVLVSNAAAHEGPLILARLGLDRVFDRTEFDAGKPEGLRRVLREEMGALGVPPERVLCVGDNLLNDVLPALELGCRAVLVDPFGLYRWPGLPPCPVARSGRDVAAALLPSPVPSPAPSPALRTG